MKNQFCKIMLIFLAFQMFLVTTANAFSDIKQSEFEYEINQLKERGIITGIGDGSFAPNNHLSYAEGIVLLVRALDWNVDHIKFTKEPSVNDYYPQLEDEKWYSQAFIIAHLNGLPIPKDVKPNNVLTKEQFAYLLFKALSRKEDFVFIELWKMIEDEVEVKPEYMNSIQKLLIINIVTLDKGYFYPKQVITREFAAKWVYQTLEFLQTN